jgi:hypothetical protein
MKITYDHNYVRVIDQVLSADHCDRLRCLFEEQHAQHTRRDSEWVSLTELALTAPDNTRSRNPLRNLRAQQDPVWPEVLEPLAQRLRTLAEQYGQTWGTWQGISFLPQDYSMEGMRIKCYRPHSGDQFRTHVDVANRASSSRFLSFLLYLNDSDAGTHFARDSYTVQAQEGRVVLFPPLWTHPHAGLEPKGDTTKYILSTYLHYL